MFEKIIAVLRKKISLEAQTNRRVLHSENVTFGCEMFYWSDRFVFIGPVNSDMRKPANGLTVRKIWSVRQVSDRRSDIFLSRAKKINRTNKDQHPFSHPISPLSQLVHKNLHKPLSSSSSDSLLSPPVSLVDIDSSVLAPLSLVSSCSDSNAPLSAPAER